MSERRKQQRRSNDKDLLFRDRRRLDRQISLESFKELLFAAKKKSPSSGNRIVITGIGVVSPIGIGKDDFWNSLEKGISGIKSISLFDTSAYPSQRAGEISGFNPAQYLGKKGLRTLDRSTLLLAVAGHLAKEDASFHVTETGTYDTGIVTGTSMGSVSSISEFDKTALVEGPSCVNPALFPNTVINSPSSHVGIMTDIRGLNATICSGFCSALDAVIYGCDSIVFNRASTILAGAVEELCHQTFLGFLKSGCLAGGKSDENETAEDSMPFDKRRNGLVLGEGAGVLILEDLEHAKARNAGIYGEILGFGRAFDAGAPANGHNPKADGAADAMNKALKNAHLDPDCIDLICASANSSPAGDRTEVNAVKRVFGNRAKEIPVTAIKSMTGEGFSLSGSLQLMAALLALNKGIIPPTINHHEPDPKCDIDCVPNTCRYGTVRNAMVNSFSPHGNNVSVLIGSYEA